MQQAAGLGVQKQTPVRAKEPSATMKVKTIALKTRASAGACGPHGAPRRAARRLRERAHDAVSAV